MRKTEPRNIKRDALSLYDLVNRTMDGETVEWGSAFYDAKRRYENTREAFMAARCDQGAFDNVFATVLKYEGGYSDEQFCDEYASWFSYEDPEPEAWRAAMYATAYLVDADRQTVKRFGLALHLPEGADAYYGWQIDTDFVGHLIGGENISIGSVGERLSENRMFYSSDPLEIGQEYDFAAISDHPHTTGRSILVSYRVGSDEYYDAAPGPASNVSFYRGRFLGYGGLVGYSKTERHRLVEVID